MAKKGQTFKRYTLETKLEAIRFRLEEGLSYRSICEHLEIRCKSQVRDWVQRHQKGESLKDHRGLWNRKHSDSLEGENAYLKAQVDFLKKRHPNLLGE
ncbi:hypothetical protein GCM10007416_15390 [Kroppenstedtia guangzhouensis]|uniref:Transposase n=1 Tax=Kroppenstedtia guangzhouensis TaxID=1274356 RepID=A0ABQ1GGA8_9BACL|nr:hypothetical protein GCM10007416_15390 [Kroppenstedtia guangzhouensis]